MNYQPKCFLHEDCWVDLTDEDESIAKIYADERRKKSKDLPNKHGYNGNPEETELDGVLAEMAVAKHLKIPYVHRVNNFKLPDIGETIQVRGRSQLHYDLIIREGDNPNHIYILVVKMNNKRWNVVGYIKGSEGMSIAPKSTYTPGREDVWFVPQFRLKRIPPK